MAGVCGKACAFQLHGGVFDGKFLRGHLLNRGEQALAFVEMHIRDARVKTERVVAAAERPQMHVVNFLYAFDL